MERRIGVRLLVDLSRYAPGLLPGIEGHTVGQYEVWSRASDRFVGVCFPGIATLDVLWESLEITDTEYLAQQASCRETHMEELKTARDVVWHVGPRGGFRHLTYEYSSADGTVNHTAIGFRQKADER